MAFTGHDFFELLCEVFPDDRRATFTDVASLVRRVKEALDEAQIPEADQRQNT